MRAVFGLVRLDGGQPFAFAGLWTSRRDEASAQVVRSCTIVTTRANELVAPVHDRMPDARYALPLALNTLTSIMRSPSAANRDKLTAARIVVDHVGSDPSAAADGTALAALEEYPAGTSRRRHDRRIPGTFLLYARKTG